MRKAEVRWMAPASLWDALSADGPTEVLRRPTIFRFASDTFIEDAQAVLESAPEKMADYVARAETWRTPRAGLKTGMPAG